ncbi:hypothetical protein K2W90_06340 [Candidatus Babeliales bacterium]|nr:hypothetical protein [Candidatus Babeliales bacterium]
MKLFKQSIALSLFLCLSAGHANVYAAASSSSHAASSEASSSSAAASSRDNSSDSASPSEHNTWPKHLADYLAETRFFTWLGKITLEAHEAQKINAIKRQLIKEGKPVDKESLEKELRECEKALPEFHPTSSEYYPTSSATLAPKTFGQWALVIMCITAPFLPQNNGPFDDHDNAIPELSEAGKELAALAQSGRIHRFDVCHEQSCDLKQCCTVHHNALITCCLIDEKSDIEVCSNITLRGYPSDIHIFDMKGVTNTTPTELPAYEEYQKDYYRISNNELFNNLTKTLTTEAPVTLELLLKTGWNYIGSHYSQNNGNAVKIDHRAFRTKGQQLMLPSLMAHELGHHHQATNNPSFKKRLYELPSAIDVLFGKGSPSNVQTIRLFNDEFNADIYSYLMTEEIENHALLGMAHENAIPWNFFFSTTGVLNFDTCDMTRFFFDVQFTDHPDLSTCRLPLLVELHEKYPVLVKELKEKMAAAFTEQKASASSGAASSSSSN